MLLNFQKRIIFLCATVLTFSLAGGVFVSAGTIDSTNKYAWGDKCGWINFAPRDDSNNYVGLTVTDSAITGYVWNEMYGWINFNMVENTTSGVLSGNAWGQNTGWINFDGVDINCDGKFVGTATGSTAGTINFNCSNCNVSTDWRPSSGCGGGGGPPPPPPPPLCDPHGDINKDGSINLVDFSILMFYWHDTPPANPCADINKDGTVDLRDFSIMLYWWTG